MFDSPVCQGVHTRYPEVPERKASPRPAGMAHAWPPVLILARVPPKSLAVPVSEQPKVPCVQSLQADGAQEWTWLGCPKI